MPPKAPVAKVNGGESNVQELPCALDVTFPVWNLTEVENQTRAAPGAFIVFSVYHIKWLNIEFLTNCITKRESGHVRVSCMVSLDPGCS